MSRAYRISVTESLRRHVQVEDGIRTRLEVLPVLAAERMGELLAVELEKRGFARDGKTARRTEKDGVVIEVDLGSGELTARATEESELQLKVDKRGTVADRNLQDEARDKLQQQAREDLEEKARGAEEKLRQKATEKVERKLKDLKAELDSVSTRVTAEALKIRAGELGTVEEISEDPETGSMTIKVRV
jgi:hypothetical protein